MDYDAVTLYIKANPDCSSLDVSQEFGVTVAKAFTYLNQLIELGLVYRTIVRSPTNNKKIYGYRTIPGFDEELDNGDGSMKPEQVLKNLRRLVARGQHREALLHLQSHNTWRKTNNLEEIPSWKLLY